MGRPKIRKKSLNKDRGFSLVEVMVSIFLVSLLLGVMSSVVQNAMTINAKATLRSEAGSLAFKKIQDYINLDYDSIPIGDDVTSYEVEDFSSEAQDLNLRNASAKVYIEPESELTSATTTTSYSQVVSADTAYVEGSEISSVGWNDATGDWYNEGRIRDNNYSNYTYSRYASSPDNLASPSIDLGSAQVVNNIRVNWFACGYVANNFRVEAKNSSPNVNSGWTTIASGLSSGGVSCSGGSNPQTIDVSSNSTAYRHWRLFFVDSQHPNFAVISELEAFSADTPGDTVEQNGADASSNPGQLYFSSTDLEMSEDGSHGHQSLGMIFDGINSAQGSTIDNAYLEFTADESDSGSVSLLVRAANVDNASPWSGNFAVDNAVDSNATDGSVGTTATVTWNPSAWNSGDRGSNTRVSVKNLIQEIINRPGWLPGNSIAIAVQYISGSGRRVAERNPSPQLVVEWSEEHSSTPGEYVDADLDGDVDNPTLLRATAIVTYEAFGSDHTVQYSTFIRKFGVSD